MSNLGTLLILGTVAAVLVIGIFLGLVFLALLSYVVKNMYPPVRRVALWAARLENFLPLLILYVVLIILIILLFVFALRLPGIAALLLILLVLVFVVVLLCVGTLLLLAILVYVIRALGWLYRRWKGLLGGLWPPIMRVRIKHDVGKDKDWKTHFADMRKRLSDEAEEARRKISGKNK